jgi:hypothetical protein
MKGGEAVRILRGAAGSRNSAESFPHFYLLTFAFLIISPVP